MCTSSRICAQVLSVSRGRALLPALPLLYLPSTDSSMASPGPGSFGDTELYNAGCLPFRSPPHITRGTKRVRGAPVPSQESLSPTLTGCSKSSCHLAQSLQGAGGSLCWDRLGIMAAPKTWMLRFESSSLKRTPSTQQFPGTTEGLQQKSVG